MNIYDIEGVVQAWAGKSTDAEKVDALQAAITDPDNDEWLGEWKHAKCWLGVTPSTPKAFVVTWGGRREAWGDTIEAVCHDIVHDHDTRERLHLGGSAWLCAALNRACQRYNNTKGD